MPLQQGTRATLSDDDLVRGSVRLFREQLKASLTVSCEVGSTANVHLQELDTAASFGQVLLKFDANETARVKDGVTEPSLIDSMRARLEDLRNVTEGPVQRGKESSKEEADDENGLNTEMV